jgi:hypothetical protein
MWKQDVKGMWKQDVKGMWKRDVKDYLVSTDTWHKFPTIQAGRVIHLIPINIFCGVLRYW